MRPIKISYWSNDESNNLGTLDGTTRVASLKELSNLICTKNWAAGCFRGNIRRLSEFNSTDLLVLDFDEGFTIEEARSSFGSYRHIIATTRSHQKYKGKKGTEDRFRVILVLRDTITDVETYNATWLKAKETWPSTDKQAKDASRYWYKCVDVVQLKEEGQYFDVITPASEELVIDTLLSDDDSKGMLNKNTLHFIKYGLNYDNWHNSLIQAIFDLKAQGYSQQEAQEMLESEDIVLDKKHDLVQLRDIYKNREPGDEFRPLEDGEEEAEEDYSDVLVTPADFDYDIVDYFNDKDKFKGETTGFPTLDKLLGGGMRKGEVTVLSAKAKTGKSSVFNYQIFFHTELGKTVVYASQEMPSDQVLGSLCYLKFGEDFMDPDYVVAGEMAQKLREYKSKLPVLFSKIPGTIDTEALHRIIKGGIAKGVEYFWMDHLHYMLDNPEDHKEASKLIKTIKSWALMYKIHIMLVIQPNKVEDDSTFNLNHVKGGSAIQQAVDNIILMSRDYNSDLTNISKLEVKSVRFPRAELGSFYVQYDRKTMRFQEVDKSLVRPSNPQRSGIVLPSYDLDRYKMTYKEDDND